MWQMMFAQRQRNCVESDQDAIQVSGRPSGRGDAGVACSAPTDAYEFNNGSKRENSTQPKPLNAPKIARLTCKSQTQILPTQASPCT